MPISLRTLCLVTAVLCNVHGSLEHEIPRRSFLSRRAIDGTRGRKYFDPDEEGAYDSYGSAGGQYDPYEDRTDLADIRRNVPGEPGIDYPAYTRLPQTGFTCEGRSRGYYADEVAGCQVFHVCHDVLVSSFLCPIGSTFSQKLLTCDWWTKVDCSSTQKYVGVNRNSYQQDDDEMIRNAYAMISLQSGTDITKDGLIDPDTTGSVIDYQRGVNRILDYPATDTTGNDLRNNFEDYTSPSNRGFLPNHERYRDKPEPSHSYQQRFYPRQGSRSPYHDSPIIRIQKIESAPGFGGSKDFQQDYRGPSNEFNQFQPSYAPTVPTVTTTTRRFYSPTVPTTFRPSTIAYSKLDQLGDTTDYLYSRNKNSFATPPTRIFPHGDRSSNGGLKGSTRTTESPVDQYDEYDYDAKSAEDDSREKSEVTDEYRLNRSDEFFSPDAYRSFHGRLGDRNYEDIDTRGSIGLGHALRQSLKRIGLQERAEKDKGKNADYRPPETKPEATTSVEVEVTTEPYQRNTESPSYTDSTEPDAQTDLDSDPDTFVPSTTPSYVESTISATTSAVRNDSAEDSSSSVSSQDSIDRMDVGPRNYRPVAFLSPPDVTRDRFRINVPAISRPVPLTRYTNVDLRQYPETRTTLARATYAERGLQESTTLPTNYESFANYQTTQRAPLVSLPRLPAAEVIPPFVDYNDGFEDFLPPEEDTTGPIDPVFSRNATEEDVLARYNSGFQFTIRDAVRGRFSSRIRCDRDKPCMPIDRAVTPIPSAFRSTASPQPFTETTTTRPPTVVPIGPSTIESINLEFSGSVPETRGNVGGSKATDERRTQETSTASLPGTLRQKTLKEIETVHQDNTPYQVSLTLSKDEPASTDDFIDRLIAERGKKSSPHQQTFDVTKSTEPQVRVDPGSPSSNSSERRDSWQQAAESDHPAGFKNPATNVNSLSLLQLMAELLKLDRVPRPFAVVEDQHFPDRLQPRTVPQDVNLRTLIEARKETSTEEVETPRPLRKALILGRLNENFGRPLYRMEEQQVDGSRLENNGDSSQTGNEEAGGITTTLNQNTRTTQMIDDDVTMTTVLSMTTDSTVVKTEFLPSIGFSFDTDQGRQEYVDAVLGGLIDENAERKTTTPVTTDIPPRNETSRRT